MGAVWCETEKIGIMQHTTPHDTTAWLTSPCTRPTALSLFCLIVFLPSYFLFSLSLPLIVNSLKFYRFTVFLLSLFPGGYRWRSRGRQRSRRRRRSIRNRTDSKGSHYIMMHYIIIHDISCHNEYYHYILYHIMSPTSLSGIEIWFPHITPRVLSLTCRVRKSQQPSLRVTTTTQ